MRLYLPVILAFVVVIGACTNGNTTAKPAPPPSPRADAADLAQGPAADRPNVAATALTTFPAVALDGLGAAELKVFTQIVNEEICPCDCPKSFGACLQAGTKCQPAVLLADWLVGQLAEGVPAETMAEQIANEVSAFASTPKTPVTTGYAQKGAAKPKHTVVEYADFECAHCRAAAAVIDELSRRRQNDVAFFYKHFPLSFHVLATPAAEATEAAGVQGRFWEMHDAIFATQNTLSEELFVGHAKAIGLDVVKWEADRKSAAVKDRVAKSRAEGEVIGIESTPTFFIDGRPFNLMRTPDAFEVRFSMEDARSTSSCQ